MWLPRGTGRDEVDQSTQSWACFAKDVLILPLGRGGHGEIQDALFCFV